MVDPGLLQRVKRTIVIFEAFDGSYSRASNCSNRGYAGALGSTIDMDSAGTTLLHTAAKLGAGQTKLLTNHPQHWGVGINVERLGLTVEVKSNHKLTSLNRVSQHPVYATTQIEV